MVTDGIAILKVGPALTYGLREGKLKLDPRELAMDGIVQFMLDYESAV